MRIFHLFELFLGTLMGKKEQIEKTENYLREIIVEELAKMQQADLNYMQFVMMGQSVEILGGFLDQKPMKAKGQSARRFAAAVKYLFGGRYRLLNENNFLYDKLRNQMVHAFIPGEELVLIRHPQADLLHLGEKDGRLILVAETFYEDICKACERLLHGLKEGKIKPKNIAFGNGE